MQVTTRKVVAGKVVVEGLSLDEGEIVTIVRREPSQGGVTLNADEEAELLKSLREADRGDTVAAAELLSRLRR